MTSRKDDDPQAKKWFIAYTKPCQERKAAEILKNRGVECYVPVQKEIRQWSDRKKVVERLVLPHIVFVHCEELTRLKVLADLWQLTHFMSQHKGPFKPAIVPDDQMELFRRFVEHGDYQVQVSAAPLAPGDMVRVMSGPFAGCECECVTVSDKKLLVTRLPILGAATVEISRETVEKL